MRRSSSALLLLSLSWVVGCSPVHAPLYAPHTHTGLSASGQPYSSEVIEQAILRGMYAKRWVPLERGPGFVRAEVSAGGHRATVRVVFDAASFHIQYESSSPGLKYGQDPDHGAVIHRRYNHWVRMLDETIRRELFAVTQLPSPSPVVVVPPSAPAPASTLASPPPSVPAQAP